MRAARRVLAVWFAGIIQATRSNINLYLHAPFEVTPMKPKTMILMVLAITCGLGASYMTSRLLAERTTPEEEKVEILVATKNLSVGQRLTKPEELFEKKQVTKDLEPPDAIKDFEQLKGKIMKQSRNKGDHVTAGNLRGNEGLDIPEGHFAMGLRVNLEGSASGFASLPQSRVNIIQTVRAQETDASYAHVLLENVLVLAADLKYNPDGELAAQAQVVTFALTSDEVLKVSLAKETGILTLALRKLDDKSSADKKMVRNIELRGPNLGKETAKVVETPTQTVKPTIVDPTPKPAITDDGAKFTKSYYDIVSGKESGPREVTRVFYNLFEDGTIEVTGTQVIAQTNAPVPNKGSGAREF